MEAIRKKLQTEIAVLERELTVDLPREIQRARALGDLSENAEYHAAKERQRLLEARVGQLRKRLSDLSLVDMSKISRDRIGLGSTVVVLDVDKGEEMTIRLVTSEETDVAKGQLSTSSPIGRGLIGKEVGDVVKIQIPGGTRELEVLKFTTMHDQPS